MLSLIKRVFSGKKSQNAEEILKYPQGKRYYPDFHHIRKSNLDEDAVKVINRLHQFSFKAYVVGGCVRDMLLGRSPKDYDIVTNAKPNEIKKIFANSRLIGKRFKIVHIVFRGNKIIEVSTARSLPESRKMAKDNDDLLLTKDNEFGSFKDDAARRDFTINSLFFDVRNETILDYSGGYDDLNEKLVRIIGDENVSLPEDPVRMLRAIKFAALLDFSLHSKLEKGIRKHRKLIRKASAPRLHEEYNKIFRTGQSYKIFEMMVKVGLYEAIFPNVTSYNEKLQPDFQTEFSKSRIAKRLMISDRMISEHEDINTTIYYALLLNDVVAELVFDTAPPKVLAKEIKNRIRAAETDLGLTRKESERIVEMFVAQQQFTKETKERKGWVQQFKNKDFFLEAFILYKINARADENDVSIQKALFWEIGLRKKLPQAIKKQRFRPLKK